MSNQPELFMILDDEPRPRLHVSGHFPISDVLGATDGDLLDLSIQKWQYIANYIEEHKIRLEESGAGTCALCMKYVECTDCPVCETTGKGGCYDTPYFGFVRANDWEEALLYALQEVKFLQEVKDKHG